MILLFSYSVPSQCSLKYANTLDVLIHQIVQVDNQFVSSHANCRA